MIQTSCQFCTAEKKLKKKVNSYWMSWKYINNLRENGNNFFKPNFVRKSSQIHQFLALLVAISSLQFKNLNITKHTHTYFPYPLQPPHRCVNVQYWHILTNNTSSDITFNISMRVKILTFIFSVAFYKLKSHVQATVRVSDSITLVMPKLHLSHKQFYSV